MRCSIQRPLDGASHLELYYRQELLYYVSLSGLGIIYNPLKPILRVLLNCDKISIHKSQIDYLNLRTRQCISLRHRRNSRRTFSEILQKDRKFHGIRNFQVFVMHAPFFAFDKPLTEFHLKNCAPVISSNTFLVLQINC